MPNLKASELPTEMAFNSKWLEMAGDKVSRAAGVKLSKVSFFRQTWTALRYSAAMVGWRSPCFGRRMMNGSGLRHAIISDITKKLFLKLSALAWLCTVK